MRMRQSSGDAGAETLTVAKNPNRRRSQIEMQASTYQGARTRRVK